MEKKGHMGDFYRNLLRNNVAFGTAKPQQEPAELQQQQEGEEQAAVGGGGEESHWDLAGEQRGGSSPRQHVGTAARPPVGLEPQRAERGAAEAAAGSRPANEHPDGAGGKHTPGEPAAGEEQAAPGAAPAAALGERRNAEDAVAAARERYLARKRQKTGAGGGTGA